MLYLVVFCVFSFPFRECSLFSCLVQELMTTNRNQCILYKCIWGIFWATPTAFKSCEWLQECQAGISPPSEDLTKFKHTQSSLFINSLFTACARFKIPFKPSQFLVQHIVQLFKTLEFPTKRISQKKKGTSVIYKIKYVTFADASKNMVPMNYSHLIHITVNLHL